VYGLVLCVACSTRTFDDTYGQSCVQQSYRKAAHSCKGVVGCLVWQCTEVIDASMLLAHLSAHTGAHTVCHAAIDL
jgi:hypothetical protein